MANDDAVLMGATSYAPMIDFQLPQAPELPQQPEQSEQGFWNQLYGSIGQTVFQDNPRLSGRAIEGLGRVSGSESMKGFGESIVADFDDTPEHEKFIPRVSEPQDIEGFTSLMDYMGSTIGQGLGSMAMTVGGAAAGAGIGALGGGAVGAVGGGVGAIPGAAVGAVSGGATGGAIAGSFLLNYGDMYDYLAEQEGMDEDQAAHFALIPGSIMAGLDATGVGKLAAAPFRKDLSDKLRVRMVQLAVEGVATEGITEAAQQLIQETAGELSEHLGYATEDIEFADRFKSIVNAFIAGGLTGGAVGGASSVVRKPTETPDTEKDIPPAPQTAAEAGAPVEVMVEEVAEPEAAVEPVAEPEVEAEPETEAEQAAEEEVQKEEDPEEPKSDLTLTSDGKFYSKVFKHLLNLPEGIGYDRPVLDEQGKPVQEQEVDENGEPVFLESGKPKMGPVQTQRVYKVSDLYHEDERGRARGALSRFPKGELELTGAHEFLIQKALDAPGEAFNAQGKQLQSEQDKAEQEVIEAAIQWTRDDFMSKLRNKPEFMQLLEEDGKSLEQYTEDFFLENPMSSNETLIGAELTLKGAIEEGGPEAERLQSLLSKPQSILDRIHETDALGSDQFVDLGPESEVTQDEINQYIADNQWRLDFDDVRRMSVEATRSMLTASPELQALEASIQILEDNASEHEKTVRNGGVPRLARNARPSVWGSMGLRELDQSSDAFRPSLLDQVISTPSAYYNHIQAKLNKRLRRYEQRYTAYYGDRPGGAIVGRPYGQPRELQEMMNGVRLALKELKEWSRPTGSTDLLLTPESRDYSLEKLTALKAKFESLYEAVDSQHKALGGNDRMLSLRRETQDWIASKDPQVLASEEARDLWRQTPEDLRGDKPDTALPDVWRAAGTADNPKTAQEFEEMLKKWATEESIYSEQMPDRQKQLFQREFDGVLRKHKEHLLLTVVDRAFDAIVSSQRDIDKLRAFWAIETTDEIKGLRGAQKEYQTQFAKSQEMRKAEEDAANVSAGLTYTVSDQPPQLDNLSFLGGNESNKRQILIIDPSPEMRDYKGNLRDAPPGIDLKKDSYTDQERAGIPDSWWSKWPSIQDYKSAGNELMRKLYRAGHWWGEKEHGAGIHIRVHDMSIMRDGELIDILVVEEIQNDHAQYNRKRGSRISALRSLILQNRVEMIEIRIEEIINLSNSAENPNAVSGSLTLIPQRTFPIRSSQVEHGHTTVPEQLIDPELKDEYIALTKEKVKLLSQIKIGDPDSGAGADNPQAVFQNTEEWAQLAMRKIFKIAMEEGYGGIAVIGGMSAGPITEMPTNEQNLSELTRQVRDIEDTASFEVDGLLSKTVDPVWNETKWSGVWADIMYRPPRANFQVPLNINKLNQTIGLYDFLQEHKKESEYISGAKLKEFISTRDPYIGSSAQKHYDENVAKQGKIVTGAEGTPAIGDDILRDVTGKPVFLDPEIFLEEGNMPILLKDGQSGVQAYEKSPPKLWVFDDKMTKRLSGPQPLISPELRKIKGGWDRSLKDLLNDEREKAEAKRKEGVTYFEDMTHHEHASIVKRIKDSTESLPNLEYPFTASLGKAAGKAVEILGHVKGVTVTVKMSETKTATMPAANIFVGNDRLVEKDVQYLLDPKVAERIRKDHLESIRKAMEEGHDIPPESLADHDRSDGGGWGLEEDYEIEEDPESEIEALLGRDLERLSPHEMTKEEFESTATKLMHGTARKFDRFDAAKAKDRWGKLVGKERDRWYFTDQPIIANVMARHGGHSVVQMDKFAASKGDDIHTEWDSFYEATLEYYPILTDAINKVLQAGKVTLYREDLDTSELTKVEKAEDISRDDYIDGLARLYPGTNFPRVIEASVYGKTLDLTDQENIPEGLLEALKGGVYHPERESAIGRWQHEYSPALVKWARENGYGKIKVFDSYESGGQSVIGLEEFIEFGVNPHKAFILRAIKEGKRVPPEVLEDYPDLKEMVYGTPPGPGETHGKFVFSAKGIDVSGPKTYISGLLDEIAASGGWGFEEDYEIEEDVEADVEPEPLFESVLTKAVAGLKQKKIGLDQVESTLQGIAKRHGSAITEAEIRVTGLRKFIEDAKASGQKSVSKEDLAKHVEANQMQISEVVFGDPETSRSPEVAEAMANFDMAFNTVLPTIRSLGDHHLKGRMPDEQGFTVEQIHRMKNNPQEVVYGRAYDRLNTVLENTDSMGPKYMNQGGLYYESQAFHAMGPVGGAIKSISDIRLGDLAHRSGPGGFDLIYQPEAIVEAIEKIDEAYPVFSEYMSRPDVAQTRKEDIELMSSKVGPLAEVLDDFQEHLEWIEDAPHDPNDSGDRSEYLPIGHSLKQAWDIVERNRRYDAIKGFISSVDGPHYEGQPPVRALFQRGNLIKDLLNDPNWVDFIEKRDELEAMKGDAPVYENVTLPGGENYYEIVLTATGPALLGPHERRKLLIENRIDSLHKQIDEMANYEVNILDDWAKSEGRQFFVSWNEIDQVEKSVRDKALKSKKAREGLEAELLDLVKEKRRYEPTMGDGGIVAGPELKDEHRKTVFTGAHHDVDNIVAHIRLKVRIDSEGRRILFVEEIQSDWHQAGRIRGYSEEENKALLDAARKEGERLTDMQEQLVSQEVAQVMLERQQAVESGNLPPASGRKDKSDILKDISRQRDDLGKKQHKLAQKIEKIEMGPVAEGELKKTQEWAGLAVRRVLREAAEGGYDGVAFTSGDSAHSVSGGNIKGQRKFYDEILPSIVKKESKSKVGKTIIEIPRRGQSPTNVNFNFVEMTPEVKARGMRAQKLFEVLIAASSVPAAAALMGEDEEEPERAEQ